MRVKMEWMATRVRMLGNICISIRPMRAAFLPANLRRAKA